MGICLLLKTDITVGIALLGQTNKPLDEIPQIEPHHKHLQYLTGVDTLVVQQLLIHLCFWTCKQHTQNVDGIEPSEWHYFVSNDKHLLL